jgi:hypothetical protein
MNNTFLYHCDVMNTGTAVGCVQGVLNNLPGLINLITAGHVRERIHRLRFEMKTVNINSNRRKHQTTVVST